MYIIIRLCLGLIVFCVSFFFIQKSQFIHKKCWILILTIATLILLTILALFPFENVFITFSSPEAAYNYMYNGEIRNVIEGKKTDMVIAGKNSTDTIQIIPKSDTGWKLGTGSDIKIVTNKVIGDVCIYLYQYTITNEHYLIIMNADSGELKITDTLETEFLCESKYNASLAKHFYTYYGYVGVPDDDYSVTVNNEEMFIFESSRSDYGN